MNTIDEDVMAIEARILDMRKENNEEMGRRAHAARAAYEDKLIAQQTGLSLTEVRGE